MCGVVGHVAPPGGRVAPGTAHLMCSAIIHRGPDDEGVYEADGISIGMRRLSIIDLASGHQPIHNETEDVWLVFNGEIYNYRELRGQLISRGHRFYTNSDSEVIVHAYEEFGVDCFAKLRGMFAIAIWDGRARELILARDRFGKKPLFYALLEDGSMAFGSELKTLLPLPRMARDLNPQALRDYLLFGYIPTPRSIFRDVQKLEPGSWLRWSGKNPVVAKYWRLEFSPKLVGSENELTERLAHEVEEAVRIRLVSDVPFGAFLSGGLDSSVVTAFMAKHLSEPVRTFTIGFREAIYDETEDARRVAAHFGARHEQLIADPDATSLLERIIYHLDEPFGDSSAIPTFIVSELAGRHVKMVLSGDGGDEMFGGYSRYGRFQTLLRLQRAGAAALSPMLRLCGKAFSSDAGRRVESLANRLQAEYPASYLSGVALMSADLADLLLKNVAVSDYGLVEQRFDRLRPGSSEGWLDAVIAGDIQSYLLDDILVKVDRMTMANSIEARSPLLDHQLAEFAARLPESMKWRDGLGKRLFRNVAARVLPKECLAKRKQGFAIPLREWFRGPLYELLRERLADSNSLSGMIDYARILKMAEDHRKLGIDHSEPLWLALNLEMWWQRFVAQKRGMP